MPKLVASRSLEDACSWQNSAVLRDDLATEAAKRKQEQDIVVMGSASVVRTLMAHDLVDEYRLLVFPLVLGTGTRLFPDGTAPGLTWPWYRPRPGALLPAWSTPAPDVPGSSRPGGRHARRAGMAVRGARSPIRRGAARPGRW